MPALPVRGHTVRRLCLAALLVALTLVVASDPATPATPAGGLAQPGWPRTFCHDTRATAVQCAPSAGWNDPWMTAVSPDGLSAYMTSSTSGSLLAFARDAATGGLTRLPGAAGCHAAAAGTCTVARALAGALAVAVSPDNEHVYVTTSSESIVAFKRNLATGALTQPSGPEGCYTRAATAGCTHVPTMGGSWDIAIAPDGSSLYIAAFNQDTLVGFSRNATTGALTVHPALAPVRGLDAPFGLAIGGSFVYATGVNSDSVAVFSRSLLNGQLSQLGGTAGCIAHAVEGCAPAHHLDGPAGVAVTKDGRNVYVASSLSDAVAVFTRNLVTGSLVQGAGSDGCLGAGVAGCTTVAGGFDNVVGVAAPDNAVVLVSGGTQGANPHHGGFVPLRRDVLTGVLTAQPGGWVPGSFARVTASAEGKSLYAPVRNIGPAPVYDQLRVYARDTATNTVTAPKDLDPCYSPLVGACASAPVGVAMAVAGSADSKFVYTVSRPTSSSDGSVGVLARTAATGALQWVGCASTVASCANPVPAGVLSGSSGMTISPDGKFVYTTSGTPASGTPKLGAVAVFERDATTGKLAYRSCVADALDERAVGTTCATKAQGMVGAQSIAITPDGLHAYVAANGSDAVVAFSRNPTTGALTPLLYGAACTAKDGAGGKCTPGPGLDGARSVVVTPDGKWVLVASEVANAVAIFSRNAANGRLTQIYGTRGCIAAAAGECSLVARGLERPSGMSITGELLTVATKNGVVVLNVDGGTGAVWQTAGAAGCVHPAIATCGRADQVVDGRAVAVSKDGKSAYVVSETSGTVTVFDRVPSSGALTQKAGLDGCLARAIATCSPAYGLTAARGIAITADDSSLYVAGQNDAALARFQRTVPPSE